VGVGRVAHHRGHRARRGSGGGSTGAAWERLRSGRSGGKRTSASQRRASITGGGVVARMSGLIAGMVRVPRPCCGGRGEVCGETAGRVKSGASGPDAAGAPVARGLTARSGLG
jgi:hypothetical protein